MRSEELGMRSIGMLCGAKLLLNALESETLVPNNARLKSSVTNVTGSLGIREENAYE